MKINGLIVVGTLFVAAGITGLVHPQWLGHEDRMEIAVGNKKLEVHTRRVVDIPPVLSGAVLVAGLGVIGLGAIGLSRKKQT